LFAFHEASDVDRTFKRIRGHGGKGAALYALAFPRLLSHFGESGVPADRAFDQRDCERVRAIEKFFSGAPSCALMRVRRQNAT
jgi:hypothetical protein